MVLMDGGIIFPEESYAIQGAIFAVYQGMGATGMKLGLLVNFGHSSKVELVRIAM